MTWGLSLSWRLCRGTSPGPARHSSSVPRGRGKSRASLAGVKKVLSVAVAASYCLPPACTLSFRFAANQPIQLFVGKVSVSNCICCCQLATHLTCRKTAGQAWILLHFVRIIYISPCILSVSALSLCLLQDRPVAASTITQLIKVVNNPDKLAALQVRGRGRTG